MAINGYTVRVASNIAYTDGSWEPNAAAFGSGPEGAAGGGQLFHDVNWIEAMGNLYFQESTNMDAFFALFTPTTIMAMGNDSGKTISSFTVHISGQVAYDDNTWSGFDFEIYSEGSTVLLKNNMSGTVGNDAFATLMTEFQSWFDTARTMYTGVFAVPVPNY